MKTIIGGNQKKELAINDQYLNETSLSVSKITLKCIKMYTKDLNYTFKYGYGISMIGGRNEGSIFNQIKK
jgi:hypothetical protein